MSFSYLLKISSLAILLSAVPILGQAAQAQTLTFSDSPTNSLVTGIKGLDVGGVLYDVTFSSGSFNSVFGSASGLDFTTASAAQTAHQAVLMELGSFALTEASSINDGFFVPYSVDVIGAGIVEMYRDSSPTSLSSDFSEQTGFGTSSTPVGTGTSFPSAWADFSPAAAVPTPALLPSLIGFGVAAFRKHKLAQSDAD